MPQLDFFTFPHQYLIASCCFCGLYYFNLLFFFEWIKFLQLSKIFALNSTISNWIIVIGDFFLIVTDLFKFEEEIYLVFKKKIKKLNRKFFLKKINVLTLDAINLDLLNLILVTLFLFLFFFLKNFLIFNAEKLMLVYFLIIVTGIILVLKFYLNNLFQTDLKKILFLVMEIESEGDRALIFLKEFLLKLKDNLVHTQLELLLLWSLEVQLIRKIKW